ncbi:MAG: hypothetical protein EZS28_032071 [Streblomastix strix]|uniref:Uncharacterized protein n=1 Tax=Streblomastix strix TaxID=222440 RepID=A0A5J4UQS3_9EUKA|nr:MAG: hypothetical protein EZS28_032071 [Streblomastix strix]
MFLITLCSNSGTVSSNIRLDVLLDYLLLHVEDETPESLLKIYLLFSLRYPQQCVRMVVSALISVLTSGG